MHRRRAYPLPEPDLSPRGVHLATYLDHGRPVALAIDHDGERVAEAVIIDPANAAVIVRRLWSILEAHDPAPHGQRLRLMH